MGHKPNFNPWLYCPHTCQHVPVSKNSRRRNKDVSYTFEGEVIIAGEVQVYHRYSNRLPLHMKDENLHPDCDASCPAHTALGKNHAISDCLYEVSPVQMERWGPAIALLYMDTAFSCDIPEKFKRDFRSRTNEFSGARDRGDPTSSAEAGSSSTFIDTSIQHHSTHPEPSSGIPRKHDQDRTPPTTSCTILADMEPFFPQNNMLGSVALPLTMVWVEDPTRGQNITQAKEDFIKASISPKLLSQLNAVFPQQVYFLDEKGKRTENPLTLPSGQPNSLVYENVGVT